MDQLVYTFEPKNGAFQAPFGVSIKRPFLLVLPSLDELVANVDSEIKSGIVTT